MNRFDDDLESTYQCDGDCYGKKSGLICGAIDFCEKTRRAEFWATVVAMVVELFAIIGVPILIVYFLFSWIMDMVSTILR